MIKISAKDQRLSTMTLTGQPKKVEVEYDPLDVVEFDNRDECYSMWDETWGSYVDVPEGRLFLERTYRAEGKNPTARNELMDRPSIDGALFP